MIREWLARKLFPQAFKDAERYFYLRRRLDELQDWCGHEEPELDHALVWAKKSLNVHFMSLDEMDSLIAKKEWAQHSVGNIYSFREQLRARRRQLAAA